MNISIVVPVYNECENIANLHREINDMCVREGYTYEIIFVDDGSSDSSFQVAQSLTPITYMRLRKNFGQTAAMDAGIKAAKYDYIVTLDGDGQNDPADIPNLLKHLEENDLDVVSGWRKNRKDSFLKKFTSRGANLLRGIIVKDNIHDSGCSLKVYRKECFQNINLYGEMHRFIPALLKIKGFNIGELVVNHRPRTAGKTKYNWKRTVKGFIDMISVWFWNKYAVRPLHLLGSTGIVMIFLGIICAMWTTLLFINGIDLTDNFQPMITIVFLLSGLFCIISGFICDILLKIYFGLKVDLPYSVKDMIRNENVDV